MTDIIVKKSGGDGSTKNLDDEFIEVNKRKQTVELGLDKMTEMKLSKYEEFRLLRE
jgi:transcriptional antiterminator Rof (Rho-off)